ncbi:MAG TPA: hypothetical protein VFB75_09545 [Burkholderiales bacterium]|nr:hypothetical protein [Burkholderiales bacterium]
MRKLTLALIAGCMSAAMAGAYAASGSPADSDKAGRQGPGTAAGEQGAVNPSGADKGGAMGKRGTASGAAAGTGATSSGTGAGTSGTGASATTTTGSSATASTGTDEPKGRRSRRAARAEKG